MKIPKLFLPEKNLDDKTEMLREEEVKLPKPESRIEKSELEEVLKLFGDPATGHFVIGEVDLYSKIENLIAKSGYKPITSKKQYWNYWSKPSPHYLDESRIFLRYFDEIEHDYTYVFARVEDSKVEEFCKRFGKKRRSWLFGKMRDLKNEKRLEACYKELITSDKEAVKAAFS